MLCPNLAKNWSRKVLSFSVLYFQALQKLDEDIYEIHNMVIERAYSVFENIYRYAMDLVAFLEELNNGAYVQLTMEGLFRDKDGKQLMVRFIKYLFL